MIPSVQFCACCGDAAAVPMLEAPDTRGQSVAILHCPRCCALIPSYPPSEEDEVARQVAFHSAFWSNEDDAALRRDRDRMCGMLKFHDRYLPDRMAPHLIYDIGAGRGNLLACLVAEGYTAVGCEPSTALVARARATYGLDETVLIETTADAFLDARTAELGRIDVVFLWHVLEHLQNPARFIAAVAKYLGPRGVIIGQGPLLSPDHVYPEHLFLHSESNIAWLAEQAGLKLVMLEARNPERFVSFVLAASEHPAPSLPCHMSRDPLQATGALYATLSSALRLLKTRAKAGDWR